jgi:hypothetical protein
MNQGVLLATLILAAGAAPQTGLPLEDPLGWWLSLFETSAESMLPGTLPDLLEVRVIGDAALGSGLSGPAGLIAGRGIPAGEPLHIGTLTVAGLGTTAGQALLRDDALVTRAGCTGRIHVDIMPWVFLDERLSLWTGSDDQPPDFFTPFHQGVEKGRHLYVDWGYFRWEPSPISVSFGRIPQQWGPGRFTQLLLSDNSPPLDMLRFDCRLGDFFTFTGFTASVESDSAVYLTAHRIDLRPAANLRLGFSESILFSSDGLELAYMNPFIPWYPVQWNERDDDNAFLSLDAAWRPFQGLETYGELLIDDIQYENDGDRPNKLGWTAGLTGSIPSAGLGAVLEYTRIDRYVYSQRRPCNYYLHHGAVIGSDLGPDADRVTLSLGDSAPWPLAAVATVDYTRHGEGTVQEGWPDSAQTGGTFPSGIVEYSTGAGLLLSWYPLDWLEAQGSVRNEWVRNRDHVHGSSSSDLTSGLEFIWTW